jgi:4-aminobutyrate aminotransferase-like enzyme
VLTEERILELNAAHLLADVVGFETEEVARTASGSSVRTYGGREFVDFTGGIAVHACGHGHAEVVAAITAQAAQVLHVSDIMRHVPQLELAQFLRERFAEAIGGQEDWTFLLMNSGSESIDAAAKLALKATGRKRFVAFEGAFHGRTLFASALSRSKSAHWGAYEPFLSPLREHIHHVSAPRCAGCDLKRSECCVTSLERLLESVGSEVAAVFFEAQQGEGGYVPMAPEAAQRLRELTQRYGILLIADEIQSGFGRTGRWFGFEHLGITPDIVVIGKAVGGGLPLAGVAAPQSLMGRWQPGEHGTTFGGNPLACAAGLAALRVVEREGLVERAARLGEAVKARLCPLLGKHGVFDVRGNGLMIGVELRDAEGNPDYARCEAVKLRCREDGLLLLTCGAKIGNPQTDNSTIRLIPPLNTPEPILWQGLDVLESALKTT